MTVELNREAIAEELDATKAVFRQLVHGMTPDDLKRPHQRHQVDEPRAAVSCALRLLRRAHAYSIGQSVRTSSTAGQQDVCFDTECWHRTVPSNQLLRLLAGWAAVQPGFMARR